MCLKNCCNVIAQDWLEILFNMFYSSNMPYSSTERQDTPFLQYTTMMFFSSMRIGTMYVFYLNRVHPTQVSQPGRLTLHMSCLSSCYFRGQGEIKSTSIMNIYIDLIWISPQWVTIQTCCGYCFPIPLDIHDAYVSHARCWKAIRNHPRVY